MKTLTKFILILWSTTCINAFYRSTQRKFTPPVCPTMQQWDKNTDSTILDNEEPKFFPRILCPNYYTNNDGFQVSSKKESELKMYILPSWLISKNFTHGFPNCIVFVAE